ncbi:MAG: sensor histidine kinase, partial [Candidatus Dormibacteraeota bacterium]|nr:sensor histidine kinase [Candidatus Dormibacteraeota bacterium]
ARKRSTARGRQEEVRRQAYEQRLEVAREVHDVVGHWLTVINMQAAVALHVRDEYPELSELALETIRQTSKDALDQLRRMLAAFRAPEAGGDVPPEPRPGLPELPSLLGIFEASGLQVVLEVTGARGEVPAAVDHAAYRILQESLTNVIRHAGATTANVRVAYRPRTLEVDVTNLNGGHARAPTASTGQGIVGMQERAAAVGGDLDAGPLPDGGFRVRARFPLTQSR